MSHPTAICPFTVLSARRASRARRSTTVLATESEIPNTRLAPRSQPQDRAVRTASPVAAAIWTMAPGTAMRCTARRSRMEKWSPTPNIISMTPISASSLVSSMSAT
jgi:hypothetical protein